MTNTQPHPRALPPHVKRAAKAEPAKSNLVPSNEIAAMPRRPAPPVGLVPVSNAFARVLEKVKP